MSLREVPLVIIPVVSRKRKPRLEAEAERTVRSAMESLGAQLRRSRRARHLTQKALATQVGLSQSTISDAELGDGGSLSVDTWQRLALVLDRDLTIRLGRDALEEPADAGHLRIQELALRLGTAAGYATTFELPTRARDSALSTDVGLTHHAARRLVLIECVNTVGDLGAAIRSSDRKHREAEGLAIALGGEDPYRVHTCWIVRSTRRNRTLVATYSAIIDTRFPGSSGAWVRALEAGRPPPEGAGLVWCDIDVTRVLPRRHPPARPR